jgi:hypothetical protein
MRHKWMVFFTALVLLSLLIVPVGTAQAQVALQEGNPECPPYELDLLREKELLHSLPSECIQTYKELVHHANPAANARDGQPMATGGSDGFGYTYDDSVPYNWISATTNSGLIGDDEFTGPIEIGFTFPFYGVPQSQLYFSTNGLITFGAGNQGQEIVFFPSEIGPNNLIAPSWDQLLVGSPFNSGAIYYAQGGNAPNRYFIVEWRNVELGYGSSTAPFSFEAILHENGDILFQYQSLPGPFFWPSAGIEDSIGYDGLKYGSALTAGKAIRFSYPTLSTARLLVSPAMQASAFTTINGHKDFTITVANTGSLGVDTYDLVASSSWQINMYTSNGATPLTDTDGDSLIDTGSIPVGVSKTLIARITTPHGAQVGDNNTATVTIVSSLDSSKEKSIDLLTSIPANFINVFQDEADGAMSFMKVNSSGTSTLKATTDNYFGSNVAVTKLTNGNYLYAWDREYSNEAYELDPWVKDIEFTVLGRGGNVIRPATKLTDNVGANIHTRDIQPTIAQAPDGTIGIAWIHYLRDYSNEQYNYNIYFATLDASGDLLTGPTNITNNTIWGASSNGDGPHFYYVTIAASDDNRFVIAWPRGGDNYVDVWYAIRDTAGANVFSPFEFVGDSVSDLPVLNSLTGGKVILTWQSYYSNLNPRYAVINSDGSFLDLPSFINLPGQGLASTSLQPDAVQLPNGKVAIGWPTYDGVQFVILNSSYRIESGAAAITPNAQMGAAFSMTTDADSHVIVTWLDGYDYDHLYYALGDSTGIFLTDPMIYKKSGREIDGGWNGQGNAPFESDEVQPDTTPPTVTSIIRANTNHTSAASVNFTLTFSEPVNDVDVDDFTLHVAGSISGASVGSVTGSGSTRTLTINTGSGNGTLGLTVPVDATIHDLAGNPIGGLPVTSGETYTILKTATFSDVADSYWAWSFIERLVNAGITAGCGGGSYCPEDTVTRAQMAVFLLRGIHGSTYAPPAVGSSTGFGDVRTDHWAAAWIKQLAAEGITGGCGSGNYCPEASVTRAQMAVFLLRAKYGLSYAPPGVGVSTGFTDVDPTHWAGAWIKQLVAEGITAGCGSGNYCPEAPVTRAQMAVFLVRTFNLP